MKLIVGLPGNPTILIVRIGYKSSLSKRRLYVHISLSNQKCPSNLNTHPFTHKGTRLGSTLFANLYMPFMVFLFKSTHFC